MEAGKGPNAKRNVPLSARVRSILEERRVAAKTRCVFTNQPGTGPFSRFTVRDQHAVLRTMLKLPADAVIHSFRHTYGTRLGEAGADAFTIMKLMGHSSVTVSQRYVHPTPEAMGRAVERMESLNRKAARALPERTEVPSPYNFPYTAEVQN